MAKRCSGNLVDDRTLERRRDGIRVSLPPPHLPLNLPPSLLPHCPSSSSSLPASSSSSSSFAPLSISPSAFFFFFVLFAYILPLLLLLCIFLHLYFCIILLLRPLCLQQGIGPLSHEDFRFREVRGSGTDPRILPSTFSSSSDSSSFAPSSISTFAFFFFFILFAYFLLLLIFLCTFLHHSFRILLLLRPLCLHPPPHLPLHFSPSLLPHSPSSSLSYFLHLLFLLAPAHLLGPALLWAPLPPLPHLAGLLSWKPRLDVMSPMGLGPGVDSVVSTIDGGGRTRFQGGGGRRDRSNIKYSISF